MNPEDVVIPEVLTEGTFEQMRERAGEICELLQSLDPFLVELAVIFQNTPEGTEKDTALSNFLALDLKRREVDDAFANQLVIMRSFNYPTGECNV